MYACRGQHPCRRGLGAVPGPVPGGRGGRRGLDPVLRPGVRLLPGELWSVGFRSGSAARPPPAAQRVYLPAGLRRLHSGCGRLQAALRVRRGDGFLVPPPPPPSVPPARGPPSVFSGIVGTPSPNPPPRPLWAG